MPVFLIQHQVTEVRVFEVTRDTVEAAIAAVECGPIGDVESKESVEQTDGYSTGLSITVIGKRSESEP
jgi:hypothetical protein